MPDILIHEVIRLAIQPKMESGLAYTQEKKWGHLHYFFDSEDDARRFIERKPYIRYDYNYRAWHEDIIAKCHVVDFRANGDPTNNKTYGYYPSNQDCL